MTARLSRPVGVRRLHKEEHISLAATEEERAAIAQELELLALDSLTAELTVRPWRSEGVRVEGVVRGSLTQPCSITLEPVPATVEEAIDVRLHPDAAPTSTVDVDPDAPDPPEPLESDFVDVGAIALEHFVLGIDPYPRAPGATFEEEFDEEKEPSPFAALAALKNSLN
ncbi:MAG: DUF177 domain-containing protein [Pseudomonadota bacterium]